MDFVTNDCSFAQAKPILFRRKSLPLEKGQIYLLRGPRQVGKTTYLKTCIRELLDDGVPPRDVFYLSLDFFTSRREWRNAVNHFFETRSDSTALYLFLDEITTLDNWNLELKYLFDLGILQNGSVLATGSSALRLKEKGELLPGRGVEGNEFCIKPLSFREFTHQSIPFLMNHIKVQDFRSTLSTLAELLSSNRLDPDIALSELWRLGEPVLPFKKELGFLFRMYLIVGGLPGVVNHYFTKRYLIQQDIIENRIAEIFVRDVLGDLNRLQKQEITTRRIMQAILSRYGSRFSFSNFARKIGITHVTVIDYLHILEESFISFVHYAYDFNRKDTKDKGDKKVFIFDPFIVHALKSYLTGNDVWETITSAVDDEDFLGQLVEGIVIAHLRMVKEVPLMKTTHTFLWYYYDKNGRELDAVFKKKNSYMGVEVKYSREVDSRDLRRVTPIKEYLLLSKEEVNRGADNLVLPVDVFLSLLPTSGRNL